MGNGSVTYRMTSRYLALLWWYYLDIYSALDRTDLEVIYQHRIVLAQHNDHLDSNADWLLDQGSKITANHVVTTSGIYPFAKLIGQKPLKKLQLYPA